MNTKRIVFACTLLFVLVLSALLPTAASAQNPWFGQGCGTSYTGPGGIHAGSYSPQTLSQEQRQWLFEVFGNNGIASEGYGGQDCNNNPPAPSQPAWFGQGCGTSYTGPGGLRAGGYSPQNLSQEQRQWLFEVFGNNGTASVGYGGQTCSWQNQQPQPTQPETISRPTATPRPATSSRPQTGSLDLGNYCRHIGYADARIDPNNQTVYGWKCVGSDGSISAISMPIVCNWQYDIAMQEAYYSDRQNPYSWYCSSGGQDPNYQAPAYYSQSAPLISGLPVSSGSSGSSGSTTTNYSEPLTAIGAWYKWFFAREHIACAVFAVPNNVYNSNPRYTAWFEASDGTQINAGLFELGPENTAEGRATEAHFNVSTPQGNSLYAVCISSQYFASHPWTGMHYLFQLGDPRRWHLTIN